MSLTVISEHACFGGTMGFYRHHSAANRCDMQFSVYQPPQASDGPVPVVTFLSGLTCTEETFMIKSGAQGIAAQLGLMLVSPDTSPRGEDVADDAEGAYDFGLGAGFYLNATEAPWSQHYHMYDYVTQELAEAVFASFPGDRARQSITGHSMGGHGALTIGLRNPDVYRSISAFAPICNPGNCPWGLKALGNYLGSDRSRWEDYDATRLAATLDYTPVNSILIDQGMSDQFLEQELHPHLFEAACKENGIALELRRHDGYDHSYYFISTFIQDHLQYHAGLLNE
jgi:S-formylglutathione hydrolase